MKDFEYVKSLDSKGLKDFYQCYYHHSVGRNNCSRLDEKRDVCLKNFYCNCSCDEKHFCTANSDQSSSNNDLRFPICENYEYSI